MINHKRIVLIIVIGVLLAGNVFFAAMYVPVKKELSLIKSNYEKVQINADVIDFTSLFIKKVIQAEQEVDFETRLSLENAVRELDDTEIMTEWENFIESKTEQEAQNNVKKLLGILIDRIQK
ncbi:MAG: hypothetical protein U9R00_03075 [Patescibacteria group bacterium]|nr:hypothetical protein [Patescibacteria group bacterium]